MWLTSLALRRPLVVFMAVFTLAVAGIISYRQMPVDLLPNASFPYVFVSITYPGAGPSEVESQVTKPVEDAMAGLNGLKQVTSTSGDSYSIVVMQFNDGVDPNNAERDVQLKLNPILDTLPSGIKTPSIDKFDPSSQPSWDLAVTGNRSLDQLYQVSKDTIVPRLEAVPGVAGVTITGGLERDVSVTVDPDKLSGRGLSILDVEQALNNANVSISGGALHDGTQDYNLRVYGLAQQIQTLGELPIRSVTGAGTLRLSDVATVAAGYKDQTYLTRVNQHPGVGLLINKQQGVNTVEVAKGIQQVIATLNLPPDVQVSTIYNQAVFIDQSLNSVNDNLKEAIIITGIVLLLFLHTWRSTFIVLLSIPTSLASTFVVMHALGYSLDMMSTMGLALTIGILVDDSIVILENISRHMHRGEPPRQAALTARGEIGGAAVAITLVDVVVYTPMAFLTGVVGQFFHEFGGTIVVATLFSLLVSFTLTPMLAALLINPEREKRSPLHKLWERWETGFDALTRAYHRALDHALHMRWLVMVIALVVFVGGLALAGSGLIGSEFVTEADQSTFTAIIDLPPSTSLAETSRQVAILEQRIAKLTEVKETMTTVGIGGQYDNAQHWSAKITINLVDKNQRSLSVWQVANVVHGLAQDMPGMTLRTNLPSVVGTTSQPILVEVNGNDLNQVTEQAARIRSAVEKVPGTSDVSTTGSLGSPEFRLTVDQTKATQLGVIPAQLGALLYTAYHGDTATQFRPAGQDPTDIIVRLPDSYIKQPADITSMLMPTTLGTQVQIGQVATASLVPGPAQINRFNRQFNVEIGANLNGRPLGAVSTDIQAAVASLHLPQGITVSYQGDTQQQSQGFSSLGLALGLSIMLMYVLMVVLYNSLTYPLVVMFSLPLASVGAFLALFLTHDTFNIMSLVGIIMLSGLVAKNAILLVDYTNTLRDRGMDRNAAILEAGQTRLRPIIMTTASMVCGMLPLALNLGVGAETRSSMAVVVIGGLLTSTLLTLFVVPSAYTFMDDLQNAVAAFFQPKAGSTPAPVTAVQATALPEVNGHARVNGVHPVPKVDAVEPAPRSGA